MEIIYDCVCVKRNISEIIVNDKLDREIITTLRNSYNVLITITDELYESEDYEFIYKNISDIRNVTSIKEYVD